MTIKKQITFETTFDIYKAMDIIGEGGAGKIYKVTDEHGGYWAIKQLDPSKTTRDKIKRFKNELTFCLRNRHINIITVTDHGVNKFGPFYVMKLYDGSLRTLLKSGIEASKVLFYYSQILDGVEAAHLQKVIHRDLKPENILYDKNNDRLVICDFGIAHFEEEDLFTAVETRNDKRLANFQYAAPEQRSRGMNVDHRSDIYALGLILNEMFTSYTPLGTGFKTVEKAAPDYKYLDSLIDVTLRQKSEERPASIEEIKKLLMGYRQEFISSQKLSNLKQTVIPVSEIDDPLIIDPIRLVDYDWEPDRLTLIFNKPITKKWIQALHKMGGYSAVYGKGPEAFYFKEEKATINANEHEVQNIINHFKQWIPMANRKYEEIVRVEKHNQEAEERKALQQKIRNEEARQRVLQSVKI